jgi:hypothetical protein
VKLPRSVVSSTSTQVAWAPTGGWYTPSSSSAAPGMSASDGTRLSRFSTWYDDIACPFWNLANAATTSPASENIRSTPLVGTRVMTCSSSSHQNEAAAGAAHAVRSRSASRNSDAVKG